MDIIEINLLLEDMFKDHLDRLAHSKGVAYTAKILARKFGVDEEKAEIAGLLHDVCKYIKSYEAESLINNQAIMDEYKNSPEFYHAFAGAEFVKVRLNITDEEILNAIRYHVAGRVGMSKLEEIIYISDFTESSRKTDASLKCRILLNNNYDEAIYLSYKYTIEHLKSQNKYIRPCQIELLEYYKTKGGFND